MKKANATRFPVARIKKLIQADEDVGKVASATPIVVSKALELFLGSLVAECVKDATARGSNKITAYGLKRTITSTELFDFCSDIVAGVADPITEEGGDASTSAGGEGSDAKKKRPRKKPTAAKMDSDDEEEGAKPPTKKRKPRAKVVKEEQGDEEEEEEEVKPSEGTGKAKEEESDYEEDAGGED